MSKGHYLGDGVYVRDDGFHVVLSGNANGQDNEIYLDHYVLDSLLRFIEQVRGVEIKVSEAKNKVEHAEGADE